MAKSARRVERSPFVMLIAGMIWLANAVIIGVAAMNFTTLGWWAILLIVGGLSSMFLALATIVTGKPEWILLDLILPG